MKESLSMQFPKYHRPLGLVETDRVSHFISSKIRTESKPWFIVLVERQVQFIKGESHELVSWYKPF